jgi:hypothetical protein
MTYIKNITTTSKKLMFLIPTVITIPKHHPKNKRKVM